MTKFMRKKKKKKFKIQGQKTIFNVKFRDENNTFLS